MALLNLSRLCVAVFFISALNVAHANYVYDPVSRTWLPTATTVLAPPNSGSVFTPASGIPPNPTTSNGGFTTKAGGSFGSPPVNGSSKRVPVTINGTVTKPNVNKSVANRLFRGGLAGVALGYGIDTLLQSIGALIDDAGKVSRITDLSADGTAIFYSGFGSNIEHCKNPVGVFHFVPTELALCVESVIQQIMIDDTVNRPRGEILADAACTFSSSVDGIDTHYNYNCTGQYIRDTNDNKTIQNPTMKPRVILRNATVTTGYVSLTQQEIENAVNSSYTPDSSDYPTIVSEPTMQPTETTVDPIPRLNFPSVQTTYTDLDTGQTTVTETNIWYDFDVHNNSSSQPKIEGQQTEQTDTFKDGVKTSTSTKTTSTGVATGGAPAPAPAPPELELPPFCVWAGIVCDWIGWTQEPIEDDLDLAALITDDDYERSYSIIFGDGSCPAPIEINVIFLNQTVQLSYEPACQLAVYTKPFVLISAYIFAIMITLGVVRNG